MEKNDQPTGWHKFVGDEQTPSGDYLTAEAAARYIGMSKQRFYRAIKSRIKTYALPRYPFRRFYRLTDLEKFK